MIWLNRDRRVYIAKVPPSPSSSALSTMKMYFAVTMRVSDQMIIESAPRRSGRSGGDENVEEKT